MINARSFTKDLYMPIILESQSHFLPFCHSILSSHVNFACTHFFFELATYIN